MLDQKGFHHQVANAKVKGIKIGIKIEIKIGISDAILRPDLKSDTEFFS